MFYITSTDGVKIAVYDYNTKGKETILLIHGWPLSHKIFEYQVNFLINCGYHVMLLDLRGFGNSDVPTFGYCYNQMAEDIYTVVTQCQIDSFILGGFSMGGAIVLRYMHNYNGYGVKKLMLFAAAAPCWTKRKGFPFGVSREMVDQLICQASTDRAQLGYDFSYKQLFASLHSDAIKDWFKEIVWSASGRGTIQTAIALRDEDGRRDLAAVHVPTAIFQGVHDVVVPKELTMLQYQSIPNAKLYTLEQSGHGVMYDELELFNNYMLDFLTCSFNQSSEQRCCRRKFY